MDPRVFFPSGAPPFARPPNDKKLEIRIKKLAEFAARNGPVFIEEVRAKQSHNPEYAFLHGGEGSSYFLWALHCELLGQRPVALAPPPPASSGGHAIASLPPQVRSGWSQVLSLLNGSKESITTSQAWFMACAPYAAGMAEMMLDAADSSAAAGNYTAALRILWLANEILFKAKATQAHAKNTSIENTAHTDPIAAAFKPYLGHLLRSVYRAAGGDTEKQQAIAKVAHIWSEREIYPSHMVEIMVMEMMGVAAGQAIGAHVAGQPPPPPPPPQAFPPLPPPQQNNINNPNTMMHPGHHMHTHSSYQQQQPWRQPPPPQAQPPLPPPPPPTEPPFDPFSFPPGLIPRLVEDTLRSEVPYSPLNPSIISNSKVPPPPTLDPYLKARLDKFYAQLDAYRAGIEFNNIEGGDPPLLRSNSNKHNGVAGTAYAGGGGVRGVDDGSGGFRAADGGRGLGYGSTNTTTPEGAVTDDVFSSYRAMRSQGYHSGIGTRSRK